jgi:hypothetical protein
MADPNLRELAGTSLPGILSGAAKGVFPLSCKADGFAPEEYRLDAPIASSQLAYTANSQVLSFIIMDPAQIVKLGARAFPSISRSEAPKMVISAAGEILNSATAKLAALIGKLENTIHVFITPPLTMKFAGENALDIECKDAVFLKLEFEESFLTFISSIQMAKA